MTKQKNVNGEHTNAKIYTDQLDQNCLDQIQEITNQEPFTNQIAVMPDTHAGKGSVIGFTMPVTRKICPNTIGVDIGCGMLAVNLGKIETDKEKLQKLDEEIRDTVPLGFNVRKTPVIHMAEDFPWSMCERKARQFNRNNKNYQINTEYSIEYFKDLNKRIKYKTSRAINSMGTLGGGNHFIEIGESTETGEKWLIIHTGSRGIGATIASHHQNKAVRFQKIENIRKILKNLENNTSITEEQVNLTKYLKFDRDVSDQDIFEWLNGGKGESYMKKELIREDFNGEQIGQVFNHISQLSTAIEGNNTKDDYAHLEGKQAEQYIKDMIFAQTYASQSRYKIAADVKNAAERVHRQRADIGEIIESVHNYIDFEDQIIRKGACRARKNEKFVVPFNMKDGTLLCKGKGNPDWNYSAPHGAGRIMSRTQAENEINLEKFEEEMSSIYSSNTKENILDEAPGAYKPSSMIEKAINPTAEIVDRIKPVLNIKAE